MRGSIVKRQGKATKGGKPVTLYYIVYQVGKEQKWEAVPDRTRRGAEALLTKRLGEISTGEYREPSKMTFAEFKAEWLTRYAEGQIRHSTLEQYRYLFASHIIPALGGKPLADIGVKDVQGFKSAMLRKTRKKKKGSALSLADGQPEPPPKPLSNQTTKHAMRLLRQMLEHACTWGYLRTNPARRVKDPRVPKREMDCLTPEEARAFLEHAPPRWYAFFLTAITTGLRIGELVAMRWGNVDWGRKQYFVKETWQRPRGGKVSSFAEPKTDSSRQAVDLTPACLDALKEHRARQAEEKLKAGKDYEDQDLIFARPTGKPLDDRNVVHRIFEPALTKAELRRLRFHDLRHTCASLLIHQGESVKYVQRQLRHASAQITLDRFLTCSPTPTGRLPGGWTPPCSTPARRMRRVTPEAPNSACPLDGA